MPRAHTPRHPTAGRRGSLQDHLAAAEPFARLSEQAARLHRMQTRLDATLPPHLLPGTHVANLRQGKVVIHAASGAVAVKLRQLAPRLTESFYQQGLEVTGIEVRVQARRPQIKRPRKKSSLLLGDGAKQSLTSLAAGLNADSPLRGAIERLLRNA